MNAVRLSSRNWLGRATAGLFGGFALALGVSGLFWHFGPEGISGGSGKLQICMWMMSPVWASVFSLCFLFRDGVRAWAWISGAALLSFVLLLLLG